MSGYNVFRTDWKGSGGVTIYISENFNCTLVHFTAIPKQFELVVVQLRVLKNPNTVIGCYRPPSAVSDSIPNLDEVLSGLYWIMIWILIIWVKYLHFFKQVCDSLNLTQPIGSSTGINPAKSGQDTLVDIILTIASHKYSAIGVFFLMILVITALEPMWEIPSYPKPKGWLLGGTLWKNLNWTT